ncbi:hypothetical protein SAMN05192559_105309 [Halobacillus karajensis]|uniref:Uncharacterized protein n=1 Tax=Halobacillus karajensis TaxID=195088 RepID=A0A024P6Y9_9BACI|nr:hypothetical protein [Halobacillus karajensis]CDQ20429.1 hypothetical protein BN982_02770 [Halobacillus karajensis]CDQ24102.1 hypothetical protein BN983_02367 [Halobacillus karajensis]CDQ27580.1 hypothetical protein BN981_01848 [Halobacillus karajensis]SEH91795.1 hypothetical protein SAMN05192559_105309 [Halobacillus karajensis]
MRRVLLAILMLIIISFSYVGYTSMDMDTDANSSIPQETKNY